MLFRVVFNDDQFFLLWLYVRNEFLWSSLESSEWKYFDHNSVDQELRKLWLISFLQFGLQFMIVNQCRLIPSGSMPLEIKSPSWINVRQHQLILLQFYLLPISVYEPTNADLTSSMRSRMMDVNPSFNAIVRRQLRLKTTWNIRRDFLYCLFRDPELHISSDLL